MSGPYPAAPGPQPGVHTPVTAWSRSQVSSAWLVHGFTALGIVASMLALDEVNAEARDDLFELGAAAVPGVLQALKVATGSRYRADLVQTIGYIGGTDDIASIEPLLRDPDERVQRAATQAVARLRR